MRDTPGQRARAVAGIGVPIALVVVSLLAAGLILAVLRHDIGPWLVALGGGLATFLTVVGLGSTAGQAAGESAVQHARDGWAAVRIELARSRRHERQFAIVGIPDAVWSPSSGEPASRFQLAFDATQSIQSIVRGPDRAFADASMLHVLLTDCDREQALAFLSRAQAAMPQLFADDRVNLVVFPEDGITLGALIAQLRDGRADPIVAAVAE